MSDYALEKLFLKVWKISRDLKDPKKQVYKKFFLFHLSSV